MMYMCRSMRARYKGRAPDHGDDDDDNDGDGDDDGDDEKFCLNDTSLPGL